ncbi:MAG: hypothetical protein ACU0CT_02615 [Paracoccaceae bacterium]
MNAQTEVKAAPKSGLELLREPFKPHQISKLPKPTKAQTDAVRADFKKGIRCKVCGTWHHPDVVHLDYVGHAALTDRLLDADPNWNWEPLAFTEKGTPLRDENGGLWIKLTVCNVTRYGYGNADGKTGGDAIKELIGDALRNAAMRFGAALDLWHKGDLHADEDAPLTDEAPAFNARAAADRVIAKLRKAASLDDLAEAFKAEQETIADIKATDAAAAAEVIAEKDSRKAALKPRISADLAGDEIPY